MFLAGLFGRNGYYSYLCSVFFIVLDLRLTISEYSGTPFFLPFSKLLGVFLHLKNECFHSFYSYRGVVHQIIMPKSNDFD